MPQEYEVSYRVSTDKQGEDGNGMGAQKVECARYLASVGGVAVNEHFDVESGANDDRPGLNAAIKNCLKFDRILLVSKLDRLSRDLHFLTGLEKLGVQYVCADNPNADPFVNHIFGANAQRERRMISIRTKAGMAIARERGAKFGNPRLHETARPLASAAISRKAHETAARILPYVEAARKAGCVTLQDLCEALIARGVQTGRGGCKWNPGTLRRVLARAA